DKGSANLIRSGTLEICRGALQGRENSIAKRHLACPASFVLRGGQVNSLGSLARRPETVIDFGEIMIFCSEPEDRYGGGAGAIQFLGQTERSERLIDREARARKQADLLSGHNGNGARGEPIERCFDRGITPEGAVLGTQDLCDIAAQ